LCVKLTGYGGGEQRSRVSFRESLDRQAREGGELLFVARFPDGKQQQHRLSQ
jgi:hypothetical protein